MGRSSNWIFRAALGLLAAGGSAITSSAQELNPVPQAEADQIGALLATWQSAQPAKARRILIFWRCEGFVHGKAIEYGNKAIELAAAKTKAFSADWRSPSSPINSGSGTDADSGTPCPGLVPHVTNGLKVAASR